MLKTVSTEGVLQQSDQHAEPGNGECPLPGRRDRDPPADERSCESADVYAEVKDREPTVTSRVSFGVQGSEHGRDIGLE